MIAPIVKWFFLSVLLLAALLPTLYYLWHLFWPVTNGRVVDVQEGVRPSNGVVGPRKYRTISYEYFFEGERKYSSVQSLFIDHALGPRKSIGDNIKVAVCRQYFGLSCPKRPFFDGVVLILWDSAVLITVAANI